jgi:hypothetical protein
MCACGSVGRKTDESNQVVPEQHGIQQHSQPARLLWAHIRFNGRRFVELREHKLCVGCFFPFRLALQPGKIDCVFS